MTPAAALDALRAAGVRVRLDAGGTVRLDAAAAPPPELVALARQHRDAIAALLAPRSMPAGGALPHRYPPSWADPSINPEPGWCCSCCSGRRWWTEAHAPSGWRCWRCHPPRHLAPDDVRELRT